MRLVHASQAAVVVVACAVAAPLAVAAGRPWPDVLFGSVLLACLALLLQLIGFSVLASLRSREHERGLAAVPRDAVAGRAVEDERARLSAEIERSVERSLRTVAGLVDVARAAEDPRPALEMVQAESRAAMSELRRQLGLLAEPAPGRVVGARPVPSQAGVRRLPRRSDVGVAVALWLVMVGDSVLATTPVTALGTGALLCLVVLGRWVNPVLSAYAGAVVLTLGAVVDVPVGDGFSFPLAVGLLLWSDLVQPVRLSTLAAASVLFGTAIASRYAFNPLNGPINVVLLGVVVVVAVVVGAARRAGTRSQERAGVHAAALDGARREAAERTRREMARELHDVVSHAVSLVAVQAGAAELTWQRDPTTARAGLEAVSGTVADALVELERARTTEQRCPTWADVLRAVARMRGAGLEVALEVEGRVPDRLLPTVHRVVQEGLTNVLRHASGASARVIVRSDAGQTYVEVTDTGTGRAVPGGGEGLAGLGSRVESLGGTLVAGPTSHGFELRAVLPHVAVGDGRAR